MNGKRIVARVGLAVLIAGSAKAAEESKSGPDPAGKSVDDIAACMRANIVDRGSMRDFEVKSTDREGKVSTFKAKLFWRPTKGTGETRMTLQVLEPKSFAGTSYLVVSKPDVEQVGQVYLPATGRVQPFSGGDAAQPLWGTDFTFGELEQAQGLLLEGQTKRLGDATVLGRKAFALETKTDAEQTGYTHLRTYVDQATCTLLKTELFADGGAPRKVLEADLSTLLEVEPYWLILGYKMRNVKAGTKTDLKLSDLYLLENLPAQLFTPEGFYKPQA